MTNFLLFMILLGIMCRGDGERVVILILTFIGCALLLIYGDPKTLSLLMR